MTLRRAIPNFATRDLPAATRFYTALGFEVVMDHGWIVTLAMPNGGCQLSLLSADPSGLHPHLSLEVDDVAGAFAQAEPSTIVYPLQDEPWGVRRFFMRDPDGLIVNVLQHL